MKEKELKTLKDFEFEIKSSDGNTIKRNLSDLKTEAVKWVKDIRNSIPSTSQKKEDIRCFSESWIKHFFNITEEDLK